MKSHLRWTLLLYTYGELEGLVTARPSVYSPCGVFSRVLLRVLPRGASASLSVFSFLVRFGLTRVRNDEVPSRRGWSPEFIFARPSSCLRVVWPCFMSVSVVAKFGVSCFKRLAGPVLYIVIFLYVFITVWWIFHSRAHTRRDVFSLLPVLISCRFRPSLQCGGYFWFCFICWLSPSWGTVESSALLASYVSTCTSVVTLFFASGRFTVCPFATMFAQVFVVVSDCGGPVDFPRGQSWYWCPCSLHP